MKIHVNSPFYLKKKQNTENKKIKLKQILEVASPIYYKSS